MNNAKIYMPFQALKGYEEEIKKASTTFTQKEVNLIKKAYLMAKDICKEMHIDILHQLNMIGFREPGYLWKIKNIPFIWGPVDAKESFPIAYLDGASLKTKLFMRLKNTITRFQLKYSKKQPHTWHFAKNYW